MTDGAIPDTVQCTKPPPGTSGSSTTSESDALPVGAADQESGGDWFAPSHVYCLGMGAPSLKAVLLSVKWAARADRTVAVGPGTAFLMVLPPPQATAVTRKPRASLRSTGSFYPKEGMWPTVSNPPR